MMKKSVVMFALLGASLLGGVQEARAAKTQLQCTQQCEALFPPILVPPPEGVKPQYCTKANPKAVTCKALCSAIRRNLFPFTTIGCQSTVTWLCGGPNAPKKCVEAGYAMCDALALGT